jgi:hypothetical protein
MNVATNLECNLIEGMLGCDLSRISLTLNQYGTSLDFIFSNAGGDNTVETFELPFLKLERHHKTYKI